MALGRFLPRLVRRLGSSRVPVRSFETWDRELVTEDEWKLKSESLMRFCDRNRLPYAVDLREKLTLPAPFNQKSASICMHCSALTSSKLIMPEELRSDLDLADLVARTGESKWGDKGHRDIIYSFLLDEGAKLLNAKGRLHVRFDPLPRAELILQALAFGSPVVTGFPTCEDFLHVQSEIYMGSYEDDDSNLIGHDVVGIGYNISMNEPPHMIFLNSYGRRFGVDGVAKAYMGIENFGLPSYVPKLVRYRVLDGN